MNIDDIIKLRKYISILDHQDGKISLQFSLSAVTDPAVRALIAENKNRPMPSAILKTSVQKLMRTVKIEYDTNLIKPSDLEEILTTRSRSQFAQLTEKYMKVLSA